MNAQELKDFITAVMPHPSQIADWETFDGLDEVRFKWRGAYYVVSGSLFVEEKEGAFLTVSREAVLLREYLLLRKGNYEASKAVNAAGGE